MSAEFNKNRGDYTPLQPFKYWCEKVLPLTYDDSVSYYELLCKVVEYLNYSMDDVTTLNEDMTSLYESYAQLQNYVNTYFDNLDVQQEIDNKLDAMVLNGTLTRLVRPFVGEAVSDWLEDNVEPVGSAVIVDASLTIEGAAADAAAVGRELSQKEDVLAFDDAPTAGSLAPVHSYGIKNYVDGAVDDIEDEITDLKGDLNQTNSDINTIKNVDSGFDLMALCRWEIGTINAQSGVDQYSTTRIRTKNFIDISTYKSLTFSVLSGYKYVYDLYDTNKTLISEYSSGQWQTATQTLIFSNSVKYIRLLISENADSQANVSFASYLTVSYVTEWNDFNKSIIENEELLTGVVTLNPTLNLTKWANKSINSNTGIPFSSSTRLCSDEYVDISKFSSITISPNSGYKAYVYYYDINKEYLSGTQVGWLTAETTVEPPYNAAYVLFLIAHTNDATINTSEYTNVNFYYSTALIDASENKRTDIVSLNPDFIAKALQAKRPINLTGNGYISESKPLGLLWFSDIHGNAENLKRILDFKNTYGEYFEDTICTGDLVAYRATDGMTFWNNTDGADNILICIGNHDALADPSGYDWTQILTQEQQYEAYIEPYYENWNLTSSVSSGLTYWYKDYSQNNIRLICLNCMLSGADDTAQQSWFQNALSTAKTEGYTVVIVTHCPLSGATEIASNWTNRDRNAINDYLNASYKQYVDAFKNEGGKFACWLTGHMHWDFISKYAGTHGNQLIITIDATSVSQSNYYSDMQRTMKTKSQDLINAVYIDTSSQCIKVIRIGANKDHYLRPRNTLSISYDGAIITQE